eukprot:TRINITY_DN3243_c0_g1_i1.p2 TRINITY_DN3243_c0_g1~~TRINITY_DN3243_c0_g1_i1.p2  ORF type:complete len:473 (+),score=130.51 TRINITY_DN3243_c0_g1_i1:43-1419(+)
MAELRAMPLAVSPRARLRDAEARLGAAAAARLAADSDLAAALDRLRVRRDAEQSALEALAAAIQQRTAQPPPGWTDRLDAAWVDVRGYHSDAGAREGFARAGCPCCSAATCENRDPATGTRGTSGGVAVERCADLSRDTFVSRYEAPHVPCLVTHVVADEGWAVSGWGLGSMVQRFGDCPVQVGKNCTTAAPVRVPFRDYVAYMRSQQHDAPLYIFDGLFDKAADARGNTPMAELLREYWAPAVFGEDLNGCLDGASRQQFRWLLVGPRRSGTAVHIDMMGTNAWNTLISGAKRWALWPPDTPEAVVRGDGLFPRSGEGNEASNYFFQALPRLRRKHPGRCIEVTQLPGEAMFVPQGWWHAVVNLEDSVAVTQNYCAEGNFHEVWRATRCFGPLASAWMRGLRAAGHSRWLEEAVSIDAADGYTDEKRRQELFERVTKKYPELARRYSKNGSHTAAHQ